MSLPEAPLHSVADDAVVEPAQDLVGLPAGNPLQEAGVSKLLREAPVPIVLLAGAAKSGKTTLLASLHDGFQRKPFAGYLAAGSQTLMGFEERCFDSRVASGADEPDTQRTRPADGLLFYHMRLRNQDLALPIRQVLLADMSGELYSGAIDSGAEMRSLEIVRRADHFVHLIDGAKLISKESRAHTESNAMMLMRRCFEEQMFQSDAKIDILLTKWDIVLAVSGEKRAHEFFEAQQNTLTRMFGTNVARLRTTAVASRPHYKSELQPGYGLADLFRSWVEEPPREFDFKLRRLPIPALDSCFDRFGLTECPDLYGRPSNA